MRRLMSILTLLACLAAFPPQTTAGATQAQPTLADPPATDPALAIGDGLYTYKGIDTRHGPQCVEYAERFYATLYPGTFPFHNSGPGAYDIWEGVADQKNIGGWPTHRQYFIAYPNGTTAPQADDMLLYDRTRGGGYGHIALITAVSPQTVEILEQNYNWNTKRILPRFSNQILDCGVKGIIRLRRTDPASS